MSRERAVQLVEAAVWLRLSGDDEGARKLFERALKLDPDNEQALKHLRGEELPPPEDPPMLPPPDLDGDWGKQTGQPSPVPQISPVVSSKSGTQQLFPEPGVSSKSGTQQLFPERSSPSKSGTQQLFPEPGAPQRSGTQQLFPEPSGSGTQKLFPPAPPRTTQPLFPEPRAGTQELFPPRTTRELFPDGVPQRPGTLEILPGGAVVPGEDAQVPIAPRVITLGEDADEEPLPPPTFAPPDEAEGLEGNAWGWTPSAEDYAEPIAPRPSPALAPTAESAWDQRTNPGIKLTLSGDDGTFDLIRSDSKITPAPPDRAGELRIILRGAKDLLDLDDHTGAMELINKASSLAPEDPEVIALKARSEETLLRMFESKLGRMESIPRVLLKDDEIIWLNLDHRAGFVLAQIDGTVSFDDLFSVSGMSRIDTARILAQLIDEGVISRG